MKRNTILLLALVGEDCFARALLDYQAHGAAVVFDVRILFTLGLGFDEAVDLLLLVIVGLLQGLTRTGGQENAEQYAGEFFHLR